MQEQLLHAEGNAVVNAAIIGASGYSGAELLRILSSHPGVRVQKVTAASSAGKRVDALYPAFAGECDLEYDELVPAGLGGIDVAFVALPSGEAMKIIPLLKERVGRIIDLGGISVSGPRSCTKSTTGTGTPPRRSSPPRSTGSPSSTGTRSPRRSLSPIPDAILPARSWPSSRR